MRRKHLIVWNGHTSSIQCRNLALDTNLSHGLNYYTLLQRPQSGLITTFLNISAYTHGRIKKPRAPGPGHVEGPPPPRKKLLCAGKTRTRTRTHKHNQCVGFYGRI